MSVLTLLIPILSFAAVSGLTLLIGRRLTPDDESRAEARLARAWVTSRAGGALPLEGGVRATAASGAASGAAASGTGGTGAPRSRRDVEGSLIQRMLKPLLQRWTSLVVRYLPAAIKDDARRRLLMAGNPWGLQAGEFLAIRAGLTVLSPALLLLLGLGTGGGLGRTAIFSVVVGALGSVVPEMWVKSKAEARRREIARRLPDVVDLLTVSVEAGLGFDAALSKVAEKSEGPPAEEFERVLQEIRVGKARRVAMRELTQRTASEDLIAFLVSVIQADQLGVGIGNVLRVQSAEMRRKRRQRAEETAMKAPIKMLFPMVVFIFPGLFIVLLGPALIRLLELFTGGGLP